MLSPYTVTIYTKQDNPYNVIPDAPIEIRERLANGTSGSLSTIYEDQEGLTPITQVGAKADSNGQFTFYAEAARYNAVYESQTVPVDIGVTAGTLPSAMESNLSLPYAFNSVADMGSSSLPVGKKVTVKERLTGSEGDELTFYAENTDDVLTPNGIDIIQSTEDGGISYKQVYDNKDGLPQMQKVMASLEADVGGVIMLVVGDSTGNETFEWVYLLLESLADRFPSYTFEWRLWNTGTDTYDAPVTISAGTGSNTFTCYNASIPGEEATFVKGERYPTITNVQAFLTLVSFGHNGLNDSENQRSELAAFTCAMATDYPDRPIVLIGQNPQTDNSNMDGRTKEIKALAAEQGYGFIDVYSAFNKFAKPLSNYMTDTVHPNLLGGHLWKSTVLKAFGAAEKGASGLPKNNMSEMVLYTAADSATLQQWSLSGGATTSKDSNSGFYETVGGSTKIISAGAGNINLPVISSDDIIQWRGKWITFAVRMRVPSGEVDDCGKIALYDGTSTVTTFKGSPESHGSKFFWQVVSIKVNITASNLRAYIYTDTGTTGGTLYVDRVTVSSGRSPKDVIPAEVTNLRELNVDSVSTKGLAVEDAIESLTINNELEINSYLRMKNVATPTAPTNAGEFKLYFNNGRLRHIDSSGTIVIVD